ncbi:MAG: exopolysaccharide biosynthesis polyprenyl glycosylphosphotransferase, partial [Rhodopila sp.]
FDFAGIFVIVMLWCRMLAWQSPQTGWLANLLVPLLTAGMIVCVFTSFRLYDFAIIGRGREAFLRACAASLISFGPFLTPLAIKTNAGQPAAAACGVAAAGLLGVATARLGFARVAVALARLGVIGRRIFIVATTRAAALSLKALLERSHEIDVIGTWDIGADAQDDSTPVEAALEGALDFLQRHSADLVILKLPLSQPNRLLEAARMLRGQPRQVLLAPSLEDGDDIVLHPQLRRNPSIDVLANMLLIKISDRPLSGWRWVAKDLLDRALALLLLLIASPAMLLITIAIWLSDHGPVFFRQKRRGYGGKTFDIIKFRTMRVAESKPDALLLKLTARDDPRIFPVGRFLRKTSLDELPQLLNVLKGDMWLVGPRPHSPYAQAAGVLYARAVQEYAARYRIKPGITGWAQVCGWRGPTETLEQLSKRVEHDLYYIENWSFLFDVKILFRTLFCAFGHENAF